MQDLQLIWIGDLQIPNSCTGGNNAIFQVHEYHKMLNIGFLDKIVIGNSSETERINWTVKSVIGEKMVSNPHATIERNSDGSFLISDESTHGTYVNFVRVLGKVALKENDVVCFGYKYGLQIKHGGCVKPFKWDLKYKVHLVPIEKNDFSVNFCKCIASRRSNGDIYTTSISQRVNCKEDIKRKCVAYKIVKQMEANNEAILTTEKIFNTVAKRRAATNSTQSDSEFDYGSRRQQSSSSPRVHLSSPPVERDATKRRGLSVHKKPNQKSNRSDNELFKSIPIEPNKASLPKNLMRIAPKLSISLSVNDPPVPIPIEVVRTKRHKQVPNCKSDQIAFIFTSGPSTSISVKETTNKHCEITLHSASNRKPNKSIYKQSTVLPSDVGKIKRCGLSTHTTSNRLHQLLLN